LFGHEKGSFTGAVQSHTGYFEQASGGTLFLDEITETSLDFQVKLLRLLETGIVMPVGGKRQIKVDVRIIASTNRCPQSAVKKGFFREDLYYRLNVFPIHVPLLNERENDIALLARHFLEANNEIEKKNISFTPAALELIKKLRYAGNVRELKNLINRAYILADKEIDADHIKTHSLTEDNNPMMANMLQIPAGVTLKNAKERFIKFTLEHCGRDYKLAANVLGISEAELANFLELFGE
jgi:DNA-binding NtrC family response regulator